MVNDLDTKLVSKENRALDKYVNLTKDYGDDFITLSAAHIEDAKYGRGHYGKAYAMESNSSSVRAAFNITFSVFWHYYIIIIMITHCLLVFYIINRPYYIILETVCVLFYVLDIILHIIFYTPQTFFSFSKTALKSKLQFILTVTFVCDLGWTYYSYFYSEEDLQEKAIPFQFLRSFVFILKIKTFYHFFMVVIKTIARILRTIFVIILYVLFFSCIAVHIFGEIYQNFDDPDDAEPNVYKYEFTNAARAFVRMFVLITTENYPDVMIPVYRYHNVTIVYYIIFIYFGVFILTSILLAIVVDNYWTIAKMNVKKERLRGRKELAIAWNLLGDGAEKLSVYDENLLMVFRMLKPKNDDEEITIFLQQLTGGINRSIIEYKSWLTRCIDILDLEVERTTDEEEDTNLMSGLVKKSGGKFMIYLTLTIQSTALQRVVIILLFVHTLLIVIFQAGEEELAYVVQWLRVGISALFVLEVSLRFSILAYLHWEDSGRKNRTHRVMRWMKRASLMNVIDVVLVILGTTANGLWFYIDVSYAVPDSENTKLTPFIAKGLCVVSSTIIFILRLLVNSEEATKVYALVKLIIPVMKDLSALFVIVIYSFASFGETIFTHSVKNTNGPNPPQMFSSSCQKYGFGSNWCSFVTLFQVSTTSNWHEKMQSIIESGAGYWGAVYFITTYIIFHMVIINLFVAISYEAYNKFVSKPKQARKSQSAANKPKKLTQRIKLRMGKFKNFLNQYTKGTRKSVSSSPRPARRASVTIKRKSLHGMREKISDSSLGEGIPEIRGNGVIEPPKTPDLSSLPREKRHEMMLKQKMQQKGEARGRVRRQRNTGDKVGSFAEVVRQYTAKSSEEISLAPGQRIKVLDKAGTKYKGVVVEGPNTGKNGWFPAFVVGSFVSEMNKNAPEKKPLPKTDSQPKFVKKQNADWTKDIIGPMTIMNPEELKELNKILKANARGSRSSTDSHRGSIDGGNSPVSPKPNTSPLTPGPRVSARASNVPMMNIVEEEEEEAEESENDNVFLEINKLYSKPMQLPEVVIEQPSIVLEDEEEKEQDQKHLQSPKIHTPEMKAKEKWKKKMANKGKEIPEWARKFMSQTNTKVADSSAIKSPTESEETDPLSRISTTSEPLALEDPQAGKSESLKTESAAKTSEQPSSLLRGLRIKLPSEKDLVVKNVNASEGAALDVPNNNLLVSKSGETESKSTILNIPDSPDKNKPVVATPSPNVTVVLPVTHEPSSQQPQKNQQNSSVTEPETDSKPAENNPEPESKRKFWRRSNRREKVNRSGSVPAALPSTAGKKQPAVVRSETEVKIVVQPPELEHIVDFE